MARGTRTQPHDPEVREVGDFIGEFGGLLFRTIAAARELGNDRTVELQIRRDWEEFGLKIARWAK